MPSIEPLLDRIRGEYREMPGLRLTLAQACRLWHVDHTTCRALLDRLVAEHFLHEIRSGEFIAWPERHTPVKASLSSGAGARVRRA
jgi:hypothetical protein